MWQQIVECSAAREVAFCIPWFGGNTFAIYWYGILASVGIFVGALYASRHVRMEGGDPDLVWDALLWVLIAGLVGGRLWYVAAEVIGGSTAYSLSDPLGIINPRGGGMNIFGGAFGGLIALLIYSRARKVDGWLVADAGLLGLLLGQGIGRFGNLINQELYGPPTNSDWFGMLIGPEQRLPQFRDLPPETRFHPTMLYEAFWLFLTFAILFYIFWRYQPRIVHGILSGTYLVMAGFGRFIIEAWRPDQPTITLSGGTEVSISRLLSMLYVLIGIIILLDRTGNLKIPLIKRPQTLRQREQAYQEIQAQRRRQQRHAEQERVREQRRKQRERARREREVANQENASEPTE
jgi:phosphatidylglycerol:prolipoprotein diacylglycerol transferase